MRKPKAFTILELLVSMAIVTMVLAMLLPSTSLSHERSKRTVCGTNLRGIGQALWLYAHEAPYSFPIVSGRSSGGGMLVFGGVPLGEVNHHRTQYLVTIGAPSPTRDLWLVLRRSFALPRQFVCPSTQDFEDPATDLTAYYDFYSSNTLSYGYQYQHHIAQELFGPGSDPKHPVMADANPYVKGGLTTPPLLDRASAWRGNSLNHTDRDGQNVLFIDGHVSFEDGPDVGLSGRISAPLTQISRGRDNIYTFFQPASSAVVDPGLAAPTLTMCHLGGRSDVCLVP